MKRLILGFGNEYCGNDGVGIIIAESLKNEMPGWDVKTGAFSGITFIETIEGYDSVVVIDAYHRKGVAVGEICELKMDEFKGTKGFSYMHSMDLPSAMEMGRQLQLKIPAKLKIIGIGVDKKGEIGDTMNPVLKEKIPAIVKEILDILH